MCEWISRLGIYYVGKSRFIIAAWGVCSAKVEEDGSLSKKTTIEFFRGSTERAPFSIFIPFLTVPQVPDFPPNAKKEGEE